MHGSRKCVETCVFEFLSYRSQRQMAVSARLGVNMAQRETTLDCGEKHRKACAFQAFEPVMYLSDDSWGLIYGAPRVEVESVLLGCMPAMPNFATVCDRKG